MSKEKRLGRGLEALIGRFASLDENNTHIEAEVEAAVAGRPPESVPLTLIDRNPYQPRLHFDEAEIESLAESLETHGLLQPLVVRRDGERFQLIAGERRLRAATHAGWSDIAVRIIEADSRQVAEIALTENLQRRDLNAIEKATALAAYLATHGGSHEDLARRLSMERASVTNLLRLLEAPAPIQEMVRRDEISAGHARAILSIAEDEQLVFAQRIVAEHWSVRTTEAAAREWLVLNTENSDNAAGGTPQGASAAELNIIDRDGKRQHVGNVNTATTPQTQQLEQELRNRFGVKVVLKHKSGKGKIEIPFASHAEFERLYDLLLKGHKKAA